jgi:hypothetical protein
MVANSEATSRARQVRFSAGIFGYFVADKANRTSALDDNQRTPE